MLEGKTKSGFTFKIDEDANDDYDLMNAFLKLQAGKQEYLDEAVTLLLGEKQKDKLRKHCTTKSGRVSATGIMKELDEIVKFLGESGSNVKN